jgi:hypothetical protein
MSDISLELKRKFDDLSGQLSPENLCCDGEAPMSYVRKRARELHKQWAELEKLAGRKVSEEEVYQWYANGDFKR